jgi:coenzyme PQQ precursor peptide PqqA
MNTSKEEKWVKPDFEEVPSSMECTAYSETLD